MPSKWIEHKGKRIFLIDYTSDDTIEKMIKTLDDAMVTVNKSEDMLMLVDYSGTTAYSEYISKLKSYGEDLKNHTKKIAVVGIAGVKKVVFTSVVHLTGINAKSVESREEGKDFLVSE